LAAILSNGFVPVLFVVCETGRWWVCLYHDGLTAHDGKREFCLKKDNGGMPQDFLRYEHIHNSSRMHNAQVDAIKSVFVDLVEWSHRTITFYDDNFQEDFTYIVCMKQETISKAVDH